MTEIERLRAALEPFAKSAVTKGVLREDYSYMQERIVDWFGPSDFRRAAAALSPAPAAEPDLEQRVADWVRTRIGEAHMHRRERAMRLLEEAVELAQAEGISFEQVRAQVGHVFNRKPGNPDQEAGGVAVCLLAWCAATGNRLRDVALREIERIEAKPVEQIRGSVARKQDADLVLAMPAPAAAPDEAAKTDARAALLAAVEKIIVDTQTVGYDYGIPHVAKLASTIPALLDAALAEARTDQKRRDAEIVLSLKPSAWTTTGILLEAHTAIERGEGKR